MRYSAIVPILAAGLVAAAPLEERAGPYTMDFNAPPGGDVTILNYALTLEYLERKFYEEGLANYTQADFIAAGFPDPFYDNLKEIYYDEQVSLPDSVSLVWDVHEATDSRLFPLWCSWRRCRPRGNILFPLNYRCLLRRALFCS
jgi:hypothetical protein